MTALAYDAPIELKDTGDDEPADTLTKAVDDLTKAVDERLKAIETKSNERLAKIERRLALPNLANDNRRDDDIERKAFNVFARRGEVGMAADEAKALTVSSDTAGGYLVPEVMLPEIQKNLVLFSPIRSVARVTPASVGEIILPKRTGRVTASWVGETTARPGTQPAYGQQKFVMHELACYVDVSNRLLEDSAFDLEGELSRDLGEEFGKAEAEAFVIGDGVDKPNGLLRNTDIATVPSALTLTADVLIDMYHALPGAYAANAVWAMNRTTIGKIRTLHAASGQYFWQESLSAGNPPAILGRPVIEFPDMPDPAAGNVPIMFGDFNAGFRIFDRLNISILRDPYTQQTNGIVRFHARRRVGGEVSKAEAFRFLKIAA